MFTVEDFQDGFVAKFVEHFGQLRVLRRRHDLEGQHAQVGGQSLDEPRVLDVAQQLVEAHGVGGAAAGGDGRLCTCNGSDAEGEDCEQTDGLLRMPRTGEVRHDHSQVLSLTDRITPSLG